MQAWLAVTRPRLGFFCFLSRTCRKKGEGKPRTHALFPPGAQPSPERSQTPPGCRDEPSADKKLSKSAKAKLRKKLREGKITRP